MNATATKNKTKQITCPNCGMSADLYLSGIWAGIWECPHCEVSDVCEHKHTHFEEVEDEDFGIYALKVSNVSVCNDCDQQLESELL